MKKRVLGLLLSMTMVAGMLTACGGSADSASTGASADGNAADATAADAPAAAGDEGKVLNIYCWNEEFKSSSAQ